MQRRTVALYIAVLGAAILTIWGLQPLERFEPYGDERVGADWDFGTLGSGRYAQVGDRWVFSTSSCDPKCGVNRRQSLDLTPGELVYVTGDIGWKRIPEAGTARLALIQLDEAGVERWEYPHSVIQGLGDREPAVGGRALLIGTDTHRGELLVQLVGENAEVSIGAVSVRSGRTRFLWKLVAGGLLVAWIGLGSWATYAVWTTTSRSRAVGVLGWSALTLGLLLAPASETGHALMRLEDLFHPDQAGDLPPAVGLPPVVGPPDHTAPTPVIPSTDAKPALEPLVVSPAEPLSTTVRPINPYRELIREVIRWILDRGAHLAIFAAFGVFVARAWRERWADVGLGLLVFAIASEALQVYSVDRGAEIFDLAYDMLGASLGAGGVAAIRYRRRSRA